MSHASPRCTRCQSCPTRAHSEWGVLAAEEVALLDQYKVCNTYERGQVIYYQGNPCLGIHCLAAGVVALRRRDELGNALLLRLIHPGQTFGHRAYFAGGLHGASAEATVRCRICFIDRAGLDGLLERNPPLGARFLRRLAADLGTADEARLQSSHLPVRTRMAHLLLQLKDRLASVDEDGSLALELPFSRKDLASIVGTRPETVARTIRALEEAGVTRFEGRRVVIPDLDRLLDEVEAPPAA